MIFNACMPSTVQYKVISQTVFLGNTLHMYTVPNTLKNTDFHSPRNFTILYYGKNEFTHYFF